MGNVLFVKNKKTSKHTTNLTLSVFLCMSVNFTKPLVMLKKLRTQRDSIGFLNFRNVDY